MMDRRRFLKSASAVALLTASPALAASDGSSPGFNGGKTQIQSTIPEVSGDFPFINLLKVSDTWEGTDPFNASTPIEPSWLDANGYPRAAALAGSGGVFLPTTLPNFKSRPANSSNYLVVTWEGNAAIRIGNIPSTARGGSTRASFHSGSGLWNGRYEWYPASGAYNANGDCTFQMVVSSIAAHSYVNNLQLFFIDDESSLLSGEIFGTQYKAVLKQSGAGVFRAMDWLLTNIATTTTWATRKSLAYPIWSQSEYRAGLYPGDIMTNSGNDYSLATDAFALADKLTMHVHFSADSALHINSQSGLSLGPSPQTLSVALTPAITFTWGAHPFSNGNPVGVRFSGNPPTGMNTGVNYYVVNATKGTFQLALTPGGPAIAPVGLNGGKIGVIGLPTLSLNGSPAYPIRDLGGQPIFSAIISALDGKRKIYATIIFDSVLQSWFLSGATPYSSGLKNGVPVEVILQLCRELGMHPFFSIPYLSLDRMTDYVPSLAAYLKAHAPSWMVPRFEAGNEVWNGLTPCATHAFNKAWAYWGSSLDWPNWTGMTTSTMGQAVAAVYGHANLGITYEILAGVQTDGMRYPVAKESPVDPVFTAAKYVASGPAQSGYTQSAASGWASAVLVSTYISPGMRGTFQEWQKAWNWHSVAADNPMQQMIDLNAYVKTLVGTNTGYAIPYNVDRWHGAKDWASRFGINKMFSYEGGYSPDLMPSYYDFSPPFRSVFQSNPAKPLPTNATQCVISVSNPANREGFPQQTGNPSVAGMLVVLAGVNGMTQLNCRNGFPEFDATADVTWAGHNLNPNQVVQFGGGNLPPNVVAGQRYFVLQPNLTPSTFQFSATRGGPAVTPDRSANSNVTVFSAFVVVSVSGNATTIDLDTSTYPAATSSPYVNFPNSQTIINDFRTSTLLHATDLETRMMDSYKAFAETGGSFPSQYEISGTGSIWPPIQPDIWGTQSGEFAAIMAYNH